jgi:hypothetical protein
MGCLLNVKGDLAEVGDCPPLVLTKGAFDELPSEVLCGCN